MCILLLWQWTVSDSNILYVPKHRLYCIIQLESYIFLTPLHETNGVKLSISKIILTIIPESMTQSTVSYNCSIVQCCHCCYFFSDPTNKHSILTVLTCPFLKKFGRYFIAFVLITDIFWYFPGFDNLNASTLSFT